MEIPLDMKRDLDKYQQARDLRISGDSIKTIAKKLLISSSTASIWTNDIQLTPEQSVHPYEEIALDVYPLVLNPHEITYNKRSS
ncbi:hypothetical protein A2631_05520 [Candidatus Daviesbacteria bacterium RIFCSPHIGHO2_01_FULL_44_29]|uniref:Uncharacterized protein n=1 Tax=Candidatus Daviesbacteria bacterium RIFCSPHIGHO2_02_FULL_43_12 TaxID=1797776 RepID=A0A1F5KJ10_9BACT|nr:MAG: hypothetical protein A2631_05520 [Candidatus Daviesbacteria bacterium RIFCSPHIGHO2_01_FULL_44_29]OGE39206.1 MAG: hypothetical protein A3E86_01265 [Candidatus Daviesbacteria bacterium RIFCSPHIGHO2_12_FULL_47_45]OGE40591.1 MAG: hypothetical protein A3D25_00545 [Candidatus Daviesbacteria bacterium RIFCSPHIGHO2_02_FULL_43_12]OGE70151.1 MAG: hypothetical protein A3B55_00315 [Candidatus Daviesbacteria bacterium RIFCSPLOWO2_01_FULL_43_15]